MNIPSKHTQFQNSLNLPPAILALFAPRNPLPYLEPIIKPKLPPLEGVGSYMSFFEDPKPTDPKWKPPEPRYRIRENKKRQRLEKHEKELKEATAKWDPYNNEKATSDPRNTLFVARLSYNTTEEELRKHFEKYGAIKMIRLVKDLKGKARGYAFIEYQHYSDFKDAHRHTDGIKIDGKRVVVDYERGRLQRGWKPRRLGGGLGNSRAAEDPNKRRLATRDRYQQRYRDQPRRGYRGGGGGYRGGYRGGGYRGGGDRNRRERFRGNDRDGRRGGDRNDESRRRYSRDYERRGRKRERDYD